MCGEKLLFCGLYELGAGSPPHVRGKEEHEEVNIVLDRITPACAGKREEQNKVICEKEDHPRMCGEKVTIIR